MCALVIRRATLHDAPELCRTHKETVRAKARTHYSDGLIEAWIGDREPHHYRRAMEDSGECIWVAQDHGTIVGFASLRGNELNALYASPAAPGGTGTALLHVVVAEARSLGLRDLVATASLNAAKFYRRRGFFETGPAELVRSGVAIPAIRMRKSIG
ncbi:MAG TPA: GNAT family N-acetyltransferase [Methylomirabilota bacterium]|jgi:N-acetylglutamate synthase-like GNAT family acetyltransferase|nr:GNAT family N-acetyltransferase [Methylomirabilota bacterium]